MNYTRNSREPMPKCVLAQAQSKFAYNLSHKFNVRLLHNTQLTKYNSAILPGIGSASNDDVLKALYVFKGNYIPFDPANRGTQEIEGRSMLSHAVHHASHAVSHAVSTVSHAAADAAAAAKRAAEAAAAKAAAEAEAARRAAAEAARLAAEEAKRQAALAAAEAEAARHAAEQIAAAAKHAAEEAQKQVDQAVDSVKQGLSSLKISDLEKASLNSVLEQYRRAMMPNKNFIVFLARSLNIDPALACTIAATAQREAVSYVGGSAVDVISKTATAQAAIAETKSIAKSVAQAAGYNISDSSDTQTNNKNNGNNTNSTGGGFATAGNAFSLLNAYSAKNDSAGQFKKVVTTLSVLASSNPEASKLMGGLNNIAQDANSCKERFN